jgi:D-lactate dehydrogenase (cytochrome)
LIVKTDPDVIRTYLEDSSFLGEGEAERVALPESAREVADLLREESADGRPVTVSAGGTGTTGGRVARGGTILATDRLAGLHELVREEGGGGRAVVGPGLPLQALQSAALREGLLYPPDPTETTAWLGGTVATNASGARSFRFGPTRRWLRRLQVALCDGSVIDLPRGRIRADRKGRLTLPWRGGELSLEAGRAPWPAVKSATGYASGPGLDLLDLFVGSEGTLGVVTEIEVALVEAPEAVLTAVAFFGAETDAWSFVRQARERSYRARGRSGPAARTPEEAGSERRAEAPGRVFEATALEYYGRDTLDFLAEAGRRFPEGARAAVQFEQELTEASEDHLLSDWLALIEGCRGLADETWVASDGADRERLRELRHSVPESMNEFYARHGQRKLSTDMAVPDGVMEEVFARYRAILDRSGLRTASFGHAGQSHLHMNLLPRDAEEAARASRVYDELVTVALERGGVLSAEHGIGKLKAERFLATSAKEEVERILAIKRLLDPALVLGRGTLLPERVLGAASGRGGGGA